jgi:hypothetical protein
MLDLVLLHTQFDQPGRHPAAKIVDDRQLIQLHQSRRGHSVALQLAGSGTKENETVGHPSESTMDQETYGADREILPTPSS